MRKVYFIILSFIIFSSATSQVLPAFGDSRTGTAGLQFLKITPDARSASLSNSVNALINDVSSVYWNPAGLTKMDTSNFHFQLSHTGYFAGIKQEFAGISYSKDFQNFWAISVINLSSGDMPVTTEFFPKGDGRTFSVNDFLLALTFAKVLSDNFSFGLSGKYINENIGDVNLHNGLFDLGFVYSVGIKQTTRFAVSVTNFGFNVSPSGKVRISTLNGQEEIDNFEKVAVPSIFRLGITTPLLNKKNHYLVLASQLTHPTDNNETLGLGFEYLYRKLLFIRTGYEFGNDQNGIPSFGIGLLLKQRFGFLKIDYGFNNREFLGNVHRISLGVSLKQKIK